jgi:hypothetical protein
MQVDVGCGCKYILAAWDWDAQGVRVYMDSCRSGVSVILLARRNTVLHASPTPDTCEIVKT